jgi:hypothetical protein
LELVSKKKIESIYTLPETPIVYTGKKKCRANSLDKRRAGVLGFESREFDDE